jgi:hypothetical protein
MRPTLLEPEGPVTADLVCDALGLVMEDPPEFEEVCKWSPLEMAVVYDWAIREHLHASDNIVRRRQRPRLIDLTEPAK